MLRWEAPAGKWVMIASWTMPTKEQPNAAAPIRSGTVFRNRRQPISLEEVRVHVWFNPSATFNPCHRFLYGFICLVSRGPIATGSEEHTSELQSLRHLV